jgi:hypothetical protein
VTTGRSEGRLGRLGLVAGIALMAASLSAQGQQGQGNIGALGQQIKRPPAPTGPAPRLPDGTIDLGDGTWTTRGGNLGAWLKPGEELPLLPAAKALMESRKPSGDPFAWCLPMGVVRGNPYPIRFIQNYTHKTPTHLFIMFELMNTFRQIFLDGRTHPAELDPTWFGHSIGRYEGDTLAVDTVGFNDKSWFDGRGAPHTDRLHTVERWTRVDAGHMKTEVLVDDPGAYSRPFTVTFESTLNPPTDELMEYVCQENNQYGFASGVR